MYVGRVEFPDDWKTPFCIHVTNIILWNYIFSERVREVPTISEEKSDERALILKDYTRFCHQLRINEERWIKKSIQAQDNALKELKRLSPNLYESAIQLDDNLLPRKIYGPKLTPPLRNYVSPDGEYIDTTKTWT